MNEPAPDLLPAKATRFADGLTMASVIQAVDQGEVFSAIKLCHGFWEHCVRFETTIRQIGLDHPLSDDQWQAVISRHSVRWPAELFLAVKEYLSKAHDYPDVLAMVSPHAWEKGYEIEGTPITGLEETESIINTYMSPRAERHDGLFWKDAIQDGSFADFLRALAIRPTVIVGPDYIRHFAEFAGLQDSTYIPVHGERAAWERDAILASVSEEIAARGGNNIVCLIEAGGLTSAWLVYELAARFPGSFFLALGQALNICNFNSIANINWYQVYHRRINDTIYAINPEWVNDERAYGETMKSIVTVARNRWHVQRRNYHPDLYQLLDSRQPDMDEQPRNEPAAFIENKHTDHELMARILSVSEQANHWANFGPASGLLEQGIHRLLALPEDRQVVTCKSATDAIQTLVGLYEYKAARPLKWVVSAFGFFSTHLGPLADATILDCDAHGILSLEKLQSLPPESWDGVIITNPFSLAENLDDIIGYARSQSKQVIVDNAAAMFTPARPEAGFPAEVISFHHTKPWGMGEGGCAILDREDADIFRALINFGVGLETPARRYASNAKMSDFDAALILQRLINLPNWQRPYQLQQRRILSIADSLGLKPLKGIPRGVVMAHVPLLAARPVGKTELDNPVLTLRKYYQPLASGCENAQRIYDHIVCVPCHPQISECSTDEIRELLSQFAD